VVPVPGVKTLVVTHNFRPLIWQDLRDFVLVLSFSGTRTPTRPVLAASITSTSTVSLSASMNEASKCG
jgi:hypothetical protein